MRRHVTGLLIVGFAVLSACAGTATEETGPTGKDGLRVASFDFAESELLAELYAQALESAGLPVVRMGRVGPREVVAPAIELDRVDLVPEYLGTALQFYGATTTDPDPTTSAAALADRLAPRGLRALEPAAAQDANAVVVTRSFAAEHDLSAISDLVDLAADLRFGGPVECPERPLCLVGLRDVYGLEFAAFIPQRSLPVTAEALRLGEIDVGLLFTTSSEADDDTLVLLEDDRRLQPAENVVPVARESALARWGPGVSEALNRISAALGTTDLREMNRAVSDGMAVSDVASAWLSSRGLLGSE